jgi:hypothetical protein
MTIAAAVREGVRRDVVRDRIRRYTRENRDHARYSLNERATLAVARLLKFPGIMATSQLEARVTRRDGTVEEYGVISRRFITTAGVNFIVSAHQNTTELEAINYHGFGTNNTAENITDTALGVEVETRSTGTQSAPAGNQYRSVATITATAPRAIVEHGIFSASTSGTLFDRSVFAVINLAIGDSIQFTYTVTYTAGG